MTGLIKETSREDRDNSNKEYRVGDKQKEFHFYSLYPREISEVTGKGGGGAGKGRTGGPGNAETMHPTAAPTVVRRGVMAIKRGLPETVVYAGGSGL